ncbi:MAG: prepilin-type N-terminal cleavage/methylation domain-containing protein [Candidatus Pacebacteria bacterium]|nr:prepilin-type N-terminal cleavage/methylation domain-containing protein [Candidatus Paceibacterota bacterium]
MKTKGFTLIELLMVIAIVSFLSTIVLGNLNSAREKGRIAAGQKFSSSLHHAIGDQLIGEWLFNDSGTPASAADTSGWENDGAITGATYETDSVMGNVMSFDGNDIVRIVNSSSLNFGLLTTNYTLGFWFKTSCDDCGIYRVNGSGHDRHIYLNNGNVCQRIHATQTICSSGNLYSDGKWHFIVQWMKKGVGQRIYIDGVEVASGTKDESDFDWALHADIGYSDDATTDYFSGSIDNVRIYNKALSVTQIQKHYAEGLADHPTLASK